MSRSFIDYSQTLDVPTIIHEDLLSEFSNGDPEESHVDDDGFRTGLLRSESYDDDSFAYNPDADNESDAIHNSSMWSFIDPAAHDNQCAFDHEQPVTKDSTEVQYLKSSLLCKDDRCHKPSGIYLYEIFIKKFSKYINK